MTDTEKRAAPDSDEAQIEALYEDFDRLHLQGLWTQTADLMPGVPTPKAVPWIWRADDLLPIADRCGELITIERGGERRAIALANPGLGGRPYATPTLWGALQHLGPRESAPAHRHMANAVRFVLEGEGVWTTVDGDACDMEPGDLVLTPAWTFHDHANNTDSPMRWFDGLDIPLSNYLDVIFYENHPDLAQPVDHRNRSEDLWATAGIRLQGVSGSEHGSPLLRYRWEHTDDALTRATANSPTATIDFVDPTTGGPPLATLGCSMTRLRSGATLPPTRRVGSAIVVVYRGRGHTTLNGERFDWGPFDMMAVPSWCEVTHSADEDSDLFVIHDGPVIEALGFGRPPSGEHSQPS